MVLICLLMGKKDLSILVDQSHYQIISFFAQAQELGQVDCILNSYHLMQKAEFIFLPLNNTPLNGFPFYLRSRLSLIPL